MAESRGDYLRTEGHMRVALWFAQLRRRPTPEAVMSRFDVCRATAYRLMSTYLDAAGLHEWPGTTPRKSGRKRRTRCVSPTPN